MTKPDWLPRELWTKLLRYRAPWRHADPTEGFLLNCCSYSPDFLDLRDLSSTSRKKKMMELLGIPELKNAQSNKDEEHDAR